MYILKAVIPLCENGTISFKFSNNFLYWYIFERNCWSQQTFIIENIDWKYEIVFNVKLMQFNWIFNKGFKTSDFAKEWIYWFDFSIQLSKAGILLKNSDFNGKTIILKRTKWQDRKRANKERRLQIIQAVPVPADARRLFMTVVHGHKSHV